MKTSVSQFLTRYGMHPDGINLDAGIREFVRQMEVGNAGHPEGLLMIPTYIRLDGDLPKGQPVIVMDAGGTNFRAATVTFGEDGRAILENFSKRPMPGTQGELSAEEFFDTLAGILEPFEGVSDTVGFCFSFPTEILENGDGRLLHFNKEVKVRDMAGRVIGEGINEALKARGLSEKHFVILNDTVATMLGAIADFPDRDYDSYIGFILGTGTNTCYIEDCAAIGKLPDLNEGAMAVNMETGGFTGFPRGEIDRRFDETTANCGDHVFEKMISGAYQGSVICLTAQQAARDGLFSPASAEKLLALGDMSMRQIDQFCENRLSGNDLADLLATDEDRETLFDLIDASFERAAKTVCVNLGAILLHSGKGRDPKRPVCVSAEGTTFYKSVLFRPKLDAYVRSFLNETLGLYCEFVKTEDSTLVGSAVAGLLNR